VKPIVSHIDLFPTLLDLCGVKAPEGPKLDGITLRPLLEKADGSAWAERTLFTHNPIDETNKYPGAVRTQQYRLVREIKGPAGGSKAVANDESATPWQLYDMKSDPGEKQDIAKANPDIVRQLSQRYDAWFADISSEGLQRFPLPVGYEEHNPVELHAPQAYYDAPLHFANGPGFANDWLTGWTDAKAKVWFDIDAVTAGDYDIELGLGCAAADAGSRVRLSAGKASLETVIPAAPAPEIPLAHRDEAGKSRYRNREWHTLKAGTLTLPKGPAKLMLVPLSMPGTQVMDLKHVKLTLKKSKDVPQAMASPPGRPNVLFILADDLGIGDLRCYGNPYVDTPTLDALAKEGIRFTDHYSPSPLCAPARAGYLTGRFNHRTGAVDVPSNRGLDRIDLSEKTFGDYFHHADYATALIGKWHSGLYCRDYLPYQRGFDLFYGFANGGQDYWKWNLMRNDEPAPHDGRYLSDALNDEAIKFIRANKGKPFSLFLAHHAPHSPLEAPEDLVRKYRERLGKGASEAVSVIYAMIERMDTGLARVFEAMKAEGLWERTVIVFTSDNGAWLRNDPKLGPSMRFHGEFSGNKGDVAEQGIRVPAIVSWPGHIPGGRVVTTPIHGCDWLPTLYSLTRRSAPDGAKPFDGVNLMPLLLDKNTPALAERTLLFQRNRYAPVRHVNAAIREGQWKLLWPGDEESLAKDSARDNPSYLRGIIHPHWEMPMDAGLAEPSSESQPPPRLYDLESDPAEQHDLAATHPDLVKALSRKHDAWFGEVLAEWTQARERIVTHDRAYWSHRTAPDAAALFKDFWIWGKVPKAINRKAVDPLKLFHGYWDSADALK
jgi:arylsulfatase A